jgi:PAS domain S-box-containing protein
MPISVTAERALDAVPYGILAVDADGVILFANQPVATLLGYRPDELRGRRADSVLATPSVETATSSLPTDEGTVTIVGVRDVTMFQALLEAAPDAILGVDGEGIIRLVNRQCETVFGYGREELIGKSIDRLVPERSRDVHPGHRERYFANPRTRPMGAGVRLAARRKDGSEFPVDIALSHLTTEQGPMATAIVRDISEQWAWAERERLQVQLHQSQRLESLGQLAGGIAHDFNNLLVVILNYATFVNDALVGAGAAEALAEALADVEQIRRAAERAAALTHQLLMFSRREVVNPKVLDLNAIVADLDKLLRRTIGEHIVLTARLDPALWPILADPSQMEQVLVNLAVNARDAMPGGGELVVETANVVLDDEAMVLNDRPGPPPGPYVRLSVTDSGTGMTREVVERAFDPFFTTKPRGQGSGLGLATVYGVVTDARGHIGVYSEPGTGTTFRIYVPRADADESALVAPPPRESAAGGDETILVTEDEDAVREMALRILGRNGYHVLVASSGDEALAMLRDTERHVDLLLTDVVMPGMSGKELSERAAEARPGLRTLFMSGYSEEFIGRRVLEPGVFLIEKPFTAETLLARVREVLTR